MDSRETQRKPTKKQTGEGGASEELKQNSTDKLADMPSYIRTQIERCLDVHAPGGNNWPEIAEHFNIENEVIRNWNSRKNEVPAYSATAYMLEKLGTEQPELTVDDLQQACIVKLRYDVVRIIDKYYVNQN